MGSLIVILGYLLVISHFTNGHDTNKDGFNYYKDYLRGRADDPLEEEPASVAERMLYFYRTPLQVHPELTASGLEQEYRKRTGNAYKNHMLSKELQSEVGAVEKRAPKTALSLILDHLHNYHANQDFVAPGPGMAAA